MLKLLKNAVKALIKNQKPYDLTEVKIKIKYCYDERFDEWEALLIPQISCDEFQNIPPVLRSKKIGFFGEYLHKNWGHLSEDRKYREKFVVLYAKNLRELKEKVEKRINEETQNLAKVLKIKN